MPQTILYESPQFRVIEHACPPDGEIAAGVFRGPTLTFVRTGVGILEVGRERTVIDSNQIVCLPAGARFRVEHFHCKGTSCAVTLELPLPSTSGTGAKTSGWIPKLPRRRLLPRDLDVGVSLHRLLADVRTRSKEMRPTNDPPSELEGMLRSIECASLSSEEPGLDDGARSDRIGKARVFLNAQLSEAVRLEQVAAAVGYSKYHFCRLFKEESGLTPYEYLTRLRLNEALEELDDETMEVSEIAIRLGFSSHSHFTSTFRQRTGMTPSVYRESLT